VTLATHDAALRDGLLAELGPMDVEMLLGSGPRTMRRCSRGA
jgi:hypothetical protein